VARGEQIRVTISDRATPRPLDWVNPVSRRLTGRMARREPPAGWHRASTRIVEKQDTDKHQKSTKELRHTAATGDSLPVKIPACYRVEINSQETL
jgi:hypothetical protein